MYFENATRRQLQDAANACREAAIDADDDWDAWQATRARELTDRLGWSWDFSTWSHAANILEREAREVSDEG